ncbi:hypothetical protein [Ferrimicrobium acidiphilum]|jgi:heme/copper-type cytochrome/quinol oxidase subunit 4|uniref:hypothetical protein n=1 Tax=Ferrimicrobium acidiphilum TaxID=121039 RepID=UPI0023F435EA|nr:hypothetical protein [Gammaproteobacteria bacterium]
MKTMLTQTQAFARFLWKFIIGEDITLAIGVVLGLVAVALLHYGRVASWWALPIVWIIALSVSLRRATRKTGI